MLIIRPSTKGFHLHSIESQALKMLRGGVHLDEPPEERNAAGGPVARELALEGPVRTSIIAVRHEQVLKRFVDIISTTVPRTARRII